jgi:hypothetical protein
MVARGVRGIKCELCQESFPRRIAARNLLELDEVIAPCDGILVDAIKLRLVPEPGPLKFCGPPGHARAQLSDCLDEGLPIVARTGRRRRIGERADRLGCLNDVIEHAFCRGRTNTLDQLHQPEAGDPVARVLNKAQEGQQIFDMRGVEEFELLVIAAYRSPVWLRAILQTVKL